MTRSVRYSQLALRIGLAAVFLWFGIDKFLHPLYWVHAWVPPWVVPMVIKVGLTTVQFVYLLGVFEVLVGLSFLTGVFIRMFAFLALLFLVLIAVTTGLTEITVRDVGLIGGLVSLAIWPERM